MCQVEQGDGGYKASVHDDIFIVFIVNAEQDISLRKQFPNKTDALSRNVEFDSREDRIKVIELIVYQQGWAVNIGIIMQIHNIC